MSLMIKMLLWVSCTNCTTIILSDSLIIYPVFFVIILLKDIITSNLQQLKKLFYDMTLR